jgi:hypothetical protein
MVALRGQGLAGMAREDEMGEGENEGKREKNETGQKEEDC